MTVQELKQTFESRFQDLKGFIYWQTNRNEDMVQEAMEAIWGGLQKDPYATNAYLRTRIRWRTRDVWKRGRSIDTHPVSGVKASFCILNDRDAEDKVIAECIRDNHFPLDEQVINKIDSEHFMNTLIFLIFLRTTSIESSAFICKVFLSSVITCIPSAA